MAAYQKAYQSRHRERLCALRLVRYAARNEEERQEDRERRRREDRLHYLRHRDSILARKAAARLAIPVPPS